VLVHVDDCTIAATMIALIEVFKAEIARHVEITDLSELHWLLGIEMKCDHTKCTIHLSQHSYIDSILCCYNLYDLKSVSTPMATNIKLSSSQSPATAAKFAHMCDIPYHETIGSLMYVSLRTRPDISFAVQTISRFSMKPGIPHWEAVK
jgi:Reverse transcriptase (RNA-dependent DNA polymerase)